jgi:hypothetical protein
MNPEQKEEFSKLLPKWTAYKRNLAWSFDEGENSTINRLAWTVLNRRLSSCPSCRVDAMRNLENLYNQ